MKKHFRLIINRFLVTMLMALVTGSLTAQSVADHTSNSTFEPDTSQTVFVSSVKIPEFSFDTISGFVSRENEIRAGLLYDAERNTIIWQKDMYYAYPIASLTKMMVALLTVEDIIAGKADWSDEVKVDRVYRKSRRSRAVYKTTETYTLESLVQLAMIPSNNLACSDIAKYLGGDQASFVKRMNERALSLGMKNTFYSNPSGLPGVVKEADNSASPHDLLLLSLEMLKHEQLLKITSIGYAEVSNDKRTSIFRNHNHLVIDYENDVDGLKTGYTKRARYCLAASAKKEGYRMVCIVLGVSGPYLRNDIVSSMINDYYESIGCGPMTPSSGGPIAKKSLVHDPVDDAIAATDDSTVTYKTVWVKQKKTHTVRNGETLSSIAQKYGSTYQQIKKWNRLYSNKILKGQKLLVYVNSPKKVAVKNPDILDNEDETAPENDSSEIVAVNTEKLNNEDTVNTSDSSVLKTNVVAKEVVKQPAPKKVASSKPKVTKPSEPAPRQYVYHIVQPGDTLWSIAQRYNGTSVDDLKRVNKISNSKSLKPGTRLKIKVKA